MGKRYPLTKGRKDDQKFRQELDTFINIFPELFPNAIKNGYLLKESRISKKSEIPTMDRHLFSIGHDQGQNGIGNGAG